MKLSVFAIALFISTGAAQADYGTLYLAESRESPTSSWQLGAAYGFEASNPYLNVSGVTVSAQRGFGSYFGVGVEGTRYLVTTTEMAQAVEERLKSDAITQSVLRPSASLYGFVSATPLSGQLNLFSYKTLPFDLVLRLGGGAVKYVDRPWRESLTWAVCPQFLLAQNFGVGVSIGQQLEAPFSSQRLARLEGKFGTFVRF